MNCEQAKRLMDALLDGDLDEAGRREVQQHVAGCDDCASLCADLLAVEKWARTAGPVSPRPGFTQAVMRRVEAEQPVYETPTIGLAVIAAAAVAATVIPFLLESSETAYGAIDAVVQWVGQFAQSVAADAADAFSQAVAGCAALWTSLDKLETPLSPLWMALTAAAAFSLMVVFNFVQARALAHRS